MSVLPIVLVSPGLVLQIIPVSPDLVLPYLSVRVWSYRSYQLVRSHICRISLITRAATHTCNHLEPDLVVQSPIAT